VASNNSGSGDLGALTMQQTDKLARRLGHAADRLVDENQRSFDLDRYHVATEIYDVTNDLHDSWMSRFARGER
jgi:hypothetical protein